MGEASSTSSWTFIGPEKVKDSEKHGHQQLRDQVVCWQKCKSLDYVMHGTYVPQFFCSGEMTNCPWAIRSGLSFYLCTKCSHWVKRSQQERHAMLVEPLPLLPLLILQGWGHIPLTTTTTTSTPTTTITTTTTTTTSTPALFYNRHGVHIPKRPLEGL